MAQPLRIRLGVQINRTISWPKTVWAMRITMALVTTISSAACTSFPLCVKPKDWKQKALKKEQFLEVDVIV